MVDGYGVNMSEIVDGKVKPKYVWQPTVCITPWFKTWAFQCGKCEKEVVVFAIFGKPRCPFCKTINVQDWVYVC